MSQQNVVQKLREPITLAAGDTISFRKTLSLYPASQGWIIKYEVRGGQVPIEFDSIANAPIGDTHVILVPSATTSVWIPQEYQIAGYAELAGPPAQRALFYQNDLLITPDLETVAGDVDLTTHAQRMLSLIETVLEGKATDDILDSEVEGTVIRRIPPMDLFKLRAKYRREREGELAKEAAKARRPTGRRIKPAINVMFTGRQRGVTELTGAETQDLIP